MSILDDPIELEKRIDREILDIQWDAIKTFLSHNVVSGQFDRIYHSMTRLPDNIFKLNTYSTNITKYVYSELDVLLDDDGFYIAVLNDDYPVLIVNKDFNGMPPGIRFKSMHDKPLRIHLLHCHDRWKDDVVTPEYTISIYYNDKVKHYCETGNWE